MDVEEIKGNLDKLLDEETDYETGRNNLEELRKYIDEKLQYWAQSDVFLDSFESSYC